MNPYYQDEWRFKRDTAFRKQFFVPESFAHPAKMDAQLLLWIIERYTKPGETILDPMAGSGTTMLACGLGRNVILVELEERFCKMMWDNWEQVKMQPQLGYEMGNCQIIQGDARQLEGLVDKIVTSPPYAESLDNSPQAQEQIDTGKLQPRIGDIRKSKRTLSHDVSYSSNPSNIGNLPYGNIDAVITSPPYEGIEARDRSKEASWREDSGKYPKRGDISISKGYGVDAVVTSPPYEGALTSSSQHGNTGIAADNPKLADTGRYKAENEDNIGNLKSSSYLEAMLQVYQQCWGVLKNGGLMILVTKNFIRQKQVIRLDTDTIKLCEQAGFSFLERHYRKLPSQSFWRVIYHQKHPEVEQILYEDILVFKKIVMELNV